MSISEISGSQAGGDLQVIGVSLLQGNSGDAQAASGVLRKDLQSNVIVQLVTDMANLSKAILDVKV